VMQIPPFPDSQGRYKLLSAISVKRVAAQCLALVFHRIPEV